MDHRGGEDSASNISDSDALTFRLDRHRTNKNLSALGGGEQPTGGAFRHDDFDSFSMADTNDNRDLMA